MTLKTPWSLIDPDGASGGILARIVTDREMGHVAVFDDPETARTVVETMNRAESAEQERRELERELAETRAKLARAESMLTEWPCTPSERAVLDALPSFVEKCRYCSNEVLRIRSYWRTELDWAAAQYVLALRGEKP